MPRKPRKSFVGHPSVILFLLISRAGVFQQPRDITPTIRPSKSRDYLCPIGLSTILQAYLEKCRAYSN